MKADKVTPVIENVNFGIVVADDNKFMLSGESSYTASHPFAELISRKAPHRYSPIPEILIERSLNEESHIYDAIYYIAASGKVKKILTNRDAIGLPLDSICLNGSVWNHIESVDRRERGWFCLNIGGDCQAKVSDGFHVLKPALSVHADQTPSLSSGIFTDGWSHSETTHRWSLGETSVLRFKS